MLDVIEAKQYEQESKDMAIFACGIVAMLIAWLIFFNITLAFT